MKVFENVLRILKIKYFMYLFQNSILNNISNRFRFWKTTDYKWKIF